MPHTHAPALPGLARFSIPAAVALALCACDPGGGGGEDTAAPAAEQAAPQGLAPYAERLAAIEAAIGEWQAADNLATAHRAAETARNLVVGPAGPYYGDADGDGTVAGASQQGLLPGQAGEPGIAAAGLNPCIDRDVRGGDWRDPGERWAILDRAIAAWSPANNPFPTLPSHLQRIVGWASLTLETQDLAQAREFAGHARIHSDVSRRALEGCG